VSRAELSEAEREQALARFTLLGPPVVLEPKPYSLERPASTYTTPIRSMATCSSSSVGRV
jgi:hypothetical protein